MAERRHLTDRYAKAIELLGDKESIAIRLGGIYALQQYAMDSRRPEDQLTVVEVLSAFVRLNVRSQAATENPLAAPVSAEQPRRPRWAPPTAAADGDVEKPANAPTPAPEPHALPADVLAAISVLAQLPDRGHMRADFTGADFTAAGLTGARLRGGNLRETELWGADLRRADLRSANLRNANLSLADLRGADLSGASLRNANVFLARFHGANLGNAFVLGVDITHTQGLDLSEHVFADKQLAYPTERRRHRHM